MVSVTSRAIADPETPTVEGVIVEPNSGASMYVGTLFRFKAFLRDSEGTLSLARTGVTWESSDPAVVNIDASGVAHAGAVGTATISASVGDVHGLESTVHVTPRPSLPAAYTIGNGPSSGTYTNANDLAAVLGFVDIAFVADSSITITDPIDLSSSTGDNGVPRHNLMLIAPTINIDKNVVVSNDSDHPGPTFVVFQANTINLGGRITSAGSLLPPSRVTSTATQVNVQSDAASVQQAIDLSSRTAPGTVQIAAGNYVENVTVDHAVTLHGDEGTTGPGAGPFAPALRGTQPNGTVIDVLADDVTISGVYVDGAVIGGGRSAHAIAAGGTNGLSVDRSTFTGFGGASVYTPGATNVSATENLVTPTLLGIEVTPANPSLVTGGSQQMTATGTYSEGPPDDLSDSVTWSSSDAGIATIDASGVVHGLSGGTTTISATSGGVTGSTTASVAGAPVVVPGSTTVVEGNSGTRVLQVPVTLSSAASVPVTVHWATANNTAVAPSDYIAASGIVTFAPGETAKTVSVTVNGDTAEEHDELIVVAFSNATNATIGGYFGTGAGYITDDDHPVVLPGTNVVTEGNSGTKTLQVPVTLSKSSLFTVKVQWATLDNSATAPTDYVATSGTVTFAPGQTQKTVPITVKGDTAQEPDELVVVAFSNATNATIGGYFGLGIGTIQDDDRPAISVNDVSITEGNSGTKNLTFTATLTKAAAAAVTVHFGTANGTAIAPGDYTARSGTLTIPAGTKTKTVSILVAGDKTREGNETILLNLTSPSANARLVDAQGTGTIRNDD